MSDLRTVAITRAEREPRVIFVPPLEVVDIQWIRLLRHLRDVKTFLSEASVAVGAG